MMDLTLILGLLLGADEAAAEQSRPASPPTQAPDPDRPAIPASEIKALRDSNIFAPKGPKRKPVFVPSKNPMKEAPAPAKPKPPVVTGIFFDAKLKCYLVVVEDRNESSLRQFKEPKFLKTGDEVNGLKVGLVTAEKAAFFKGEISKELLVGESLPGSDGKTVAPASSGSSDDPEAAPSDGEEKTDIKPLDHEEKTKVLEQMRKQRGKKNRPNNEEQ